VVVPFGKQQVQGIVIDQPAEPEVSATKPVLTLLDSQPVVSRVQLDFAIWLSAESLSPLPVCLDLFLPPGLSQQADLLYCLNPSSSSPVASFSPLQQRILAALKARGSLRGRQMDAALPHVNWQPAMRSLVKAGLVNSKPILPPPSVHPKTIRTAQIASPLDAALEKLTKFSKFDATLIRRKAALEYLHTEAVPTNVAWIYAASGCTLEDLKILAENELIILSETEVFRDPLGKVGYIPAEIPHLTTDQQQVWERIDKGLSALQQGFAQKPFLLHGVTGSGKTEIYLRAVEKSCDPEDKPSFLSRKSH